MKYVDVIVAVNGEIPQRYSVSTCDAHEFAAERYEHYQPNLGKYCGSLRIEDAGGTTGTHDRFERGYIFVAD